MLIVMFEKVLIIGMSSFFSRKKVLINHICSILYFKAARQQLERLPRRQQQPAVSSASNATSGSNAAGNVTTSSQQSSSSIITLNATGSRDAPIASSSSLPMVSSGIGTCNILGGVTAAAAAAAAQQQSQFLMARFMVSSLDDAELAQLERDRADRYVYAHGIPSAIFRLSLSG